jgi:hypothetical protein
MPEVYELAKHQISDKELNELKIRFIPGAPPGVCASLITLRQDESKQCEECPNPITEADGDVWFCDAVLLKKKRKGGVCYWHYNCLKQAPPSIALI